MSRKRSRRNTIRQPCRAHIRETKITGIDTGKPFLSCVCLADLKNVDGFGELSGPPGQQRSLRRPRRPRQVLSWAFARSPGERNFRARAPDSATVSSTYRQAMAGSGREELEPVIREQAARASGPPLAPQDLASLLGRAGVTRLMRAARNSCGLAIIADFY